MKNNDDWIKVFNIEDFKEVSERMERIVYNNENGFTATMFWTIDQAINMVKNYYDSRSEAPSDEAWDHVEDFVEAFIFFLEDYLQEEGIDFRDE
jgi:alanyl-tRNA synthetase